MLMLDSSVFSYHSGRESGSAFDRLIKVLDRHAVFL